MAESAYPLILVSSHPLILISNHPLIWVPLVRHRRIMILSSIWD